MQSIDPGRAILANIKSGDTTAMRELYDQYASALFGVVSRIVNDPSVAEDVLQETFVKIWKNAERYDPAKGRAFTWMMNIARNTAVDWLRSAPAKSGQLNRSIDDHVNNIGGDDLRDRIDQLDCDKILDTLSTEKRKVLDLSFFLGFTQSEIAVKEGIPLGTVKSRMRSALADLRKYFNEDK